MRLCCTSRDSISTNHVARYDNITWGELEWPYSPPLGHSSAFFSLAAYTCVNAPEATRENERRESGLGHWPGLANSWSWWSDSSRPETASAVDKWCGRIRADDTDSCCGDDIANDGATARWYHVRGSFNKHVQLHSQNECFLIWFVRVGKDVQGVFGCWRQRSLRPVPCCCGVWINDITY